MMKKFYPDKIKEKCLRNFSRASALIYTLLFTTLVAIMAFAAGKLIVSELKQTAAQEGSAQAYELATAGIENGIYLFKHPDPRPSAITTPEHFLICSDSLLCGCTAPCTCKDVLAQRFYLVKPAGMTYDNEEVNPHWAEGYPGVTTPLTQQDYENWVAKTNKAAQDGYYDLRIWTSGTTISADFNEGSAGDIIIESVGYYKDYKRILRAVIKKPGPDVIDRVFEKGSAY